MKLGLRRKKSTDAAPTGNSAEFAMASRLQELCRGDEELYRAMSRLMFLDPRKIMTPLENVLSEAQEYEAKGNNLRAEVDYRIAGGISLYKGDLDGVKRYFTKAASIAGDSRPEYKTLAQRSDEAVSIAKKYYENSGHTPRLSS